MRKDGSQSSKDIRKQESLTMRLDAQERDLIERKSEQWGVTMAQAARRLMFRPEQKPASEWDVKSSAKNALDMLSSDGQKAVKNLVSANENLLTVMRILDKEGNPVAIDESIKRVAMSILAEAQKLRSSIALASEKFDAVEFKPRGRRRSERDDKETAIVRGKLAANPEVFKNTKDETFVKLVVAVNKTLSSGTKTVTYYNVYSRYDKMLTVFRSGQTVQVEGNMSLRKNDKGETIFSVWQEKVTLLDKI